MTSPATAAERLSPVGRHELALAALAGAAAFSVVLVFPVFGVVGVPLAAVPAVRLAHRQGLISGLTACGLIGSLVFGLGWASGNLAAGLAVGFAAVILTVLPTASVGFLRAGADSSRCYVGVCLAGCALLAAAYAASAGASGPTLSRDVAAILDRGLPALLDEYARRGADAESVARLKEAFVAAREFTQYCLWGLLGAFWVFSSAISFYLGAAAARPGSTADAARFETLRVPPTVAAVFVGSGLVFGLFGGEGRRVAANILLPLLALYFVAGLSIICHFFRRWFRVRILRFGLYVLVAYVFPFNLGVALLGLFDWYVDFRRRGEGAVEKS